MFCFKAPFAVKVPRGKRALLEKLLGVVLLGTAAAACGFLIAVAVATPLALVRHGNLSFSPVDGQTHASAEAVIPSPRTGA